MTVASGSTRRVKIGSNPRAAVPCIGSERRKDVEPGPTGAAHTFVIGASVLTVAFDPMLTARDNCPALDV
jgi:hypothetical protein